jgi:hypothetical protein
MRFNPRLEKASPGLSYLFRLEVGARGGESSCAPPYHFKDGYGNTLDFSQTGPTRVRIEDNRGGYADINWDGSRFVLNDSYSAGRSEAARGPTVTAERLGDWGKLLLVLAPLLAWFALTVFVRQCRADRSYSTRATLVSIAMQAIGIISLLWLFLEDRNRSSPAGHEMGPVGQLCCWWLCSGTGLVLLTMQMLSGNGVLRERHLSARS